MTTDATFDANLDAAPRPSAHRWVNFLLMPFRPQALGRALYNLLAFPLGLFYFLALTIGTAVGVPLTLVWVGFLILAITAGLLVGFISFERELTRLLLGAQLAPRTAPVLAPRTVTQRLGDFLSNPVTWKGAAFLLLKFPLGIVSFVVTITSLATTAVFLLGPMLYQEFGFRVDFGLFLWHVDSLPEAMVLSFGGVVVLWVSLHLLNALGLGWRFLAEGLLGSESHRAAQGNGDLATVPAS